MEGGDSEGLSTISRHLNTLNNVSRSPSVSSVTDYTWSTLLISKHKRNVKDVRGEYKPLCLTVWC